MKSTLLLAGLLSAGIAFAGPPAPKTEGIEGKNYKWNAQEGEKIEALKLKGDKKRGEEAYEVELENGINIKFAKSNDCRIGDYWLIPARGDLSDGMGGILWDNKTAQPPHGTKHHFAPFAFIYPAESAWQASEWHDLRFRTVPILSREVDDLTRRVTESEEAIVELTTRTKQDIEELTKRVQSLEQKKWDLQLVEWLMTAMAVLLLLLLIYYGVKGSWWLFVIIVLIGGGLFWARQKLHPSKGDGASK